MIKCVSFESLIGPIHDTDLEGFDWVFVNRNLVPKACCRTVLCQEA